MSKPISKNDTFAGFEIPTNSLAKVAPKEGSAAWMKEVTREHGSTDPQKLERRRERLSAFVASANKGVERLQMRKRLFLADSKKMEDTLCTKLAEHQEGETAWQEAKQRLLSYQAAAQQQEAQFDILIQQQIFQMCSIDALCLVVDCVSIRDDVVSKGGKKGRVRWTSALYAMDGSDETHRLYNRTRKGYELLEQVAVKLGVVIAAPETESDDEGEDTTEYEDEDVVDEDDKKQIKKEVEGDNDY